MSDDFFKTEYTKAADGSGELFQEEIVAVNSEPVTCLGKTFANDAERRAYFTEELRKKLRDPEFRKIEGFPIGEDEDILALSDPPYYCACPNPWIGEFIKEWEREKPPKDDLFHYVREPFAADVSEGKNDPIYMLPSYHTKVPPKAIEKYLAHYTEPGDIIIDAFCGTGMAGVAANQMADIIDSKGEKGARHAILVDLSPYATFTASMMNTPMPTALSDGKDGVIGSIIKSEILPLYRHSSHGAVYDIDYLVWSDWGVCPNCSSSFRLYDVVIDYDASKMNPEYLCPNCGCTIKAKNQKKAFIKVWDNYLKTTREVVKYTPVSTSRRFGTGTVREFCTNEDNNLYDEVSQREISRIPAELKYSHMTHERNNLPEYWKITHIHDFFTKRNYYVHDHLLDMHLPYWEHRTILWALLSVLDNNSTRRNRFYVDARRPNGSPVGPLSNTLYVPTIQVETNIGHKILQFLEEARKVKHLWSSNRSVISTQSATAINQIPRDSVDFIFTDPPFGGNINYSEQNILFEWWLKVATNNKKEAITNDVQQKGVSEYQELMEECFSEYHRVLKPGRWMVVEFHNSANAIWAAIQQALEKVGFVVATVNILDKKASTLHQDHNAAAVDKDLAITVYKTSNQLEHKFSSIAGQEEGVWEFLRSHLKKLPVFISHDGEAKVIKERQQVLLFDRMVAFHVQRGIMVPMSASKFYEGLLERFPSQDEMFFLEDQIPEYRKRRSTVSKIEQVQLFVSDESSAIAWLREILKERTLTFQEINPLFMQELSAWNKYEKTLELAQLLEENFLMYDGKGEVPSQIHTYLSTNWHDLRDLAKDDPKLVAKAENRWYVPDPNKASDLEKVRDKSLLREFEEYRNATKKLKTFRLEAVRAGFKHAYQERDYATILAVGKKIPENVLEEDEKLLMWFNQAEMRVEE